MPFSEAQSSLKLPARTLRTLSFCEPTPKHLRQWIDNLPLANLGEVSRQVFHAIVEINQLIVEPEVRIKLLELIRPPVCFVCASLSKYYLNQPIKLPDKARKVSRLAKALDHNMAIGYKIIVNDCSNQEHALGSRKYKKIATLAIHRAISALGSTIVRACQLYSIPTENIWHELHQLYLIAEINQIHETPIEDAEHRLVRKLSCSDAYKRIMLLGCCRPNQLRQQDIGHIYEASQLWTKHVSLGNVDKKSTFVINLAGDAPPVYKELARKKVTASHRGLDPSQLSNHLKLAVNQGKNSAKRGFTVPDTFSKTLVLCLISAWQTLSERSFSRVSSNKSIKLSIGFSPTHYFVSGGVEFERQLRPGKTTEGAPSANISNFISQKPEKKKLADPWEKLIRSRSEDENTDDITSISYSQMGLSIDGEKNPSGKGLYKYYDANLYDSSPNGYCIKWTNDVPPEIKTGELVGINEGVDLAWSIAVIRWITQVEDSVTLMGIELIAAGAIPCGVKVVSDRQRKSEYMRALLLPAMPAVKQPASIIAPNMPFKPEAKVVLNQYGELSQGQLGELLSSSGGFGQFVFHPDIDQQPESSNHDDDDVWPEL